MKKYMIAIAIAFSALFGFTVQASPLATGTAAMKAEVAKENAVTDVYYGYRRYGWRHYGWRGYGWRRPYWRHYGYHHGWRRAYWRPYRHYGWRRW